MPAEVSVFQNDLVLTNGILALHFIMHRLKGLNSTCFTGVTVFARPDEPLTVTPRCDYASLARCIILC